MKHKEHLKSTQQHIFISITSVDMKLWPIKENGIVIANAFCNECVRLPNFDLLIISLFVKIIFVVSY